MVAACEEEWLAVFPFAGLRTSIRCAVSRVWAVPILEQDRAKFDVYGVDLCAQEGELTPATARNAAPAGTATRSTSPRPATTPPADDGTTDPGRPPNLITNVVTTHAAVADSAMTMPIHTMLADRDLLPAEHLMDAGYPSTAILLALRTEHQVRLVGPMRGDSSRHTREDSPNTRR